jgi:hypothetical protein
MQRDRRGDDLMMIAATMGNFHNVNATPSSLLLRMIGRRIGCTDVDHFLINRSKSTGRPADQEQRIAPGPRVGRDADRSMNTFGTVDSQSHALAADVNSSLGINEVKIEDCPRGLTAVRYSDMHASRISGDDSLRNFSEFHLDALMGFGRGTSQNCSDECQYESGANVH